MGDFLESTNPPACFVLVLASLEIERLPAVILVYASCSGIRVVKGGQTLIILVAATVPRYLST